MTTTNDQGPRFPGSIEIDGVVCYASDERPGTWLYVPGAPLPELAAGRPSLNAYVSPQGGILQLGAEWKVKPETLAKIGASLKQQTGQQDLDLQLAPASVREATVEIGDGQGTFAVVGTSASSGFSPYRAIFRIDLDAARKDATVAALNGRRDFVVVRYRASAALRVSVRVKIAGNVSAALDVLSTSSTSDEIRDWVLAAIDGGTLTLTEEVSGPADDELKRRTRQRAIDEFTKQLATNLRPAPAPGPGGGTDPDPPTVASDSTLSVQSVISDVAQHALERVADISAWFAPGKGSDHITTLPGRA